MRLKEHPSLPTGNVGFLERAIGGTSIPADLGNVGFLQHAIGRASIAAKLGTARLREHIFGRASVAPGMHTGLEAMSIYRTNRAGCLESRPSARGVWRRCQSMAVPLKCWWPQHFQKLCEPKKPPRAGRRSSFETHNFGNCARERLYGAL